MRRLVVAGSVLIAVTYGLARFALGLFVPELRAAFDLSATAVGVVMGASFAGYVVGLVLAGPLVDHAGARTVARSSGVVAAAGMAGIAVAPGALVLVLAAAVGGASTGLASPALAAAVETHVPSVRRAASQTAINAGTSLGLVAAVPVAVIAAATWRAAWIVFALVALGAAVGVAAALPRHGPAVADVPRCRPSKLDRRLRASAVLLGVASAAFWGFGRELLEVVSGLPPPVSRLTWVAVGVIGLAGALAGTVADRAGLRVTVAAAGGLLATSLAALAAGPTSVIVALGAAGAFGAAYMALTGLLIVWAVRERPRAPASAVATAFLLLAGGQVAGSLLAGGVADHVGLSAAFSTAAVVAVGTAVVLPRPEAARAAGPARADEAAPAVVTRGAR